MSRNMIRRIGRKVKVLLHARKPQETAYESWIRNNETEIWSTEWVSEDILFSVVVPVYNVTDPMLTACIESVCRQMYRNWELILVDDHSTWESVRTTLRSYQNRNKIKVIYRKENGNISEATNTGLQAATGDYIVFMDCDDVLSVHALYENACFLKKHPECDFVYSDEDKLTEDGKTRHFPFFKPDWSPDTFLCSNYTNHLSVYRRSLVEKTGGLRTAFNGSQDYDFVLRFMELTDNSRVGHIAKILYHWRERAESVALDPGAKPYASEAARKAKEEAIKRRGLDAHLEMVDIMYQYRMVYHTTKEDTVSIIIPSKDNPEMLRMCLESIEKNTSMDYEIILVDNGSSEKNKSIIKEMAERKNYHYLYQKMEFNFSGMCNIGAAEANGRFLLFLNDDIEVNGSDWLERLTGHAGQKLAGAVGAKLLYPGTTRIQHIGVVNMGTGPVHSLAGHDDTPIYYFGRNRLEHNWIAVTGACLMIDADKFRAAGGFDETFAVTYNDVELCFRFHKMGYYNVCRNDVVLYHHESVSRGNDILDRDKMERLEHERERLYQKHPDIGKTDIYYNVNLTQGRNDFSLDTKIVDQYHAVVLTGDEYSRDLTRFTCFLDVIEPHAEYIRLAGWYYTGHPHLDNHRKAEIILREEENRFFRIPTDKVHREDVVMNLKNGTSEVGYECRISRSDQIKCGTTYRIGVRISGNRRKQHFFTWLDKQLNF